MVTSVGNLSLIEKVGQMVIVGLDGHVPDETITELIQTYKIGGVVITEKNVQTADQLLKLVNSLKALNIGNEVPLFITASQEGGRANIFPNEIRRVPAIKTVAEEQDKRLIYDVSNHMGKMLKSFGVNMNLWPVLDIGGIVDGKKLEDRCVSNNPTLVSIFSPYMIGGLTDAGVISVPKYFPGHGTTKGKDGRNIAIPSTKKSLLKLEQADLVPFRTVIDAGIDTLLVGHVTLSKVNLFTPASLSGKVVTKLLKEKYGYKGVVIADDLSSKCIEVQYGTKNAVRKAILAGDDLMIIRDANKAKNVLEDIAKQIKKGNLDQKEIDLRVQKILDVKVKFNVDDKELPRPDYKQMNEETEALITRVRNQGK